MGPKELLRNRGQDQQDQTIEAERGARRCRAGDEVHIEARARSFLHHQVRNIVGTLKLVGLGHWHPDDVARALALNALQSREWS